MLKTLFARFRLVHQPPTYPSSQRPIHLGFSRQYSIPRLLRLPLGAGAVCLAYLTLKFTNKGPNYIQTENHHAIATNIEVSAYKALPLNAVSRWWGRIHNVNLPWWLRKPILRLYVACYHCDLSEAAEPDLSKYPNLGEFFRRSLREGVRPIHPGPCLVSPSDGEVLHLGAVESNHVEQVKGVQYPLYAFLGPNTWSNAASDQAQQLTDYHQSLLMKGGSLYHCVIYLAPGDYHRFHSPVEWTVTARRHFPGALLSVCRGIASWVPGLFHINERVVYTGQWQHGFFAMAPVGATNVGSIKVYFDNDLKTNKKKGHKQFSDATFQQGVAMNKGDSFGEFNLGSTIVLVFEAPPGSQFNIAPGQRVRYGQNIFAESCRAV